MTTVEEILAESDNFSELSAAPSFDLEDILKQPRNQYDDEDQFIGDDIERYFGEEQEEEAIMPYDMTQRDSVDPLYMDELSDNYPRNTKDLGIKDNGASSVLSQKQSQQEKSNKTISKHSRLEDLPLIPRDQIQNMIYVALKNVTQLFDISQVKGVGIATCLSSTGSKFLAIGTSLGNVALFQIGSKGYRTLTTQDQNRSAIGQVTSVAVSRDSRYMVGGFESGIIAIWDLSTFKIIKQQIIKPTRIIKVLFCSDTYQNFIVNDSLGFIYMFTIENKFWISTRHQLLVDRIQNKIYYDVKYTKLQSNRHIIALCSLESVLIISLKPTIGIMEQINRPQEVKSSKIPNCQVGVSDQKDVLCISWGKKIFLYRLIPTNYSMQNIVLHHTIQHPSVIHNLQFITKNMLLTIDDSQNYRIINLLESIQTNTCTIINQQQLEIQTIYQRFLKDKKGKWIKLYSNTMMNCSFDPKNKEVFFITKNTIYRGRLEKWTNIVHNMLGQQRNWYQALKICLELYKGNLNIFVEPFQLTKTTKQLLCDIGKVFLKQKMNDIRQKNPNQTNIDAVRGQAQQIFQVTTEYFIRIGCEQYLFQKIYIELIKQIYYYEYYELLLDSLEPFIQNGVLKKIPHYPTFLQILNKYSSKPALINKLVTSLDEKSLHYEDLVQICTKQKLYESLCYICATYGDFISPANKILSNISIFVNENIKDVVKGEQNDRLYSILKNYLENLTQLKYPNGKPINSSKKINALQEIELWISSKETLRFFTNQHEDDLFYLLEKLGSSLISYSLEHFLIDLCQQLVDNIQKPQDNNSQKPQDNETDQVKITDKIQVQIRSLRKLQKFLVKFGLYKQIHFYNSLLKNIFQFQLKIEEHIDEQTRRNSYLRLGQQLKFLNKYLLPLKKQEIEGKVNKQQKETIEFFDNQLRKKLNIYLQAYYVLVSSSYQNQNTQETYPAQLLLQPDSLAQKILVNHMGNQKNELVRCILQDNKLSNKSVEKYLTLLLKWSPEPTMVYMLGKFGIQKVNEHLKQINDEKYRYIIVRKILKYLRKQPINNSLLSSKINRKLLFGFSDHHKNKNRQIQKQNETSQPKLQKEILVLYIGSMCKYKKEKRIFYQLSSNPSDYSTLSLQLLTIFEKFKMKSCRAIMLEYQLHYTDAFYLYSEVYEQCFQMNFHKLVSHQHCHGRFMANVFHLMLDLCYRIKKEQQWSILLRNILTPFEKPDNTNAFRSKSKNTKIIDKIQRIYDIKSTKDHPFIHQLQQVIQITIISVSRQISIDKMANQLNKYKDLLGKTFILNCLSSTLQNSYKRVQSFEISKKLMVIEYVKSFKEFYKHSKIDGKSVDQTCSKCGMEVINSQKFTILSCGHGYHPKCIKNYSRLNNIIDTESNSRCEICSRKQYGDPEVQNLFGQLSQNTQKSAIRGNIQEQAESREVINTRNVYKSLAFDDYIARRELEFDNFRKQYEKSIQSYRNY